MTNTREQFAVLFENNNTRYSEEQQFIADRSQTIETITKRVAQSLIDFGYDLSFVMLRPVSKFIVNYNEQINQQVLAMSQKIPITIVMDSDIDEVVADIVQNFKIILDDLPETSRFSPYQLIADTGIILNPNNFIPSISLMTRYGILENVSTRGPCSDPVTALVKNWQASNSQSSQFEHQNQNIATIHPLLDKILERLLGLPNDLNLSVDNTLSRSELKTLGIQPIIELTSRYDFELMKDQTTSTVLDLIETNYMDEVAKTMTLSIQKIIASTETGKTFKLINLVCPGVVIDPNTFTPVASLGFEYVVV